MIKPYFTIITCTLNSSRFIGKNLRSIEEQTYNNYEHIIIDGNSTDNTLNIVNKFKNIKRYVYNFPALGVTKAFNEGIKKAKGKFVIILNSDDLFYNNKVLENTHAYLEKNSDLDWVYGQISLVDEKTKSIGIAPSRNLFKNSNSKLLKIYNFIPHQAVFIRRNVFHKYGLLDEKVRYIPDYEYWLRIADKTKWKYMDLIVSKYRLWNGSGSYNTKLSKEVKESVIKFHRNKTTWAEHTIFRILNYNPLVNLYRTYKLRDKDKAFLKTLMG